MTTFLNDDLVPTDSDEQAEAMATNDSAIRAAAEELLARIYAEYPEGLPFYCRDAVSSLDEALHPEVFNSDAASGVLGGQDQTKSQSDAHDSNR